MLRGLAESPYLTWLRNLIDRAPLSAEQTTDASGDLAEPSYLIRFFRELPLLWKTDSRHRVRVLTERVRREAGQVLAGGPAAVDRHLLMQSLHLTQIRMAGEMDKLSVVSWWEPIADRISSDAAADPAARDLLAATLTQALRNPNPFIQLSALLALNKMRQAPPLEPLSLRPIAHPEKALNPELAHWINQLLAGEARYPDPALFR